jgi:hypothetical protein
VSALLAFSPVSHHGEAPVVLPPCHASSYQSLELQQAA